MVTLRIGTTNCKVKLTTNKMKNLSKPLATELYRMTMPMIIGVLAIMSYQLVDSAFIGQLGVQPLAAVGFTIPVYQLIIGIQVGIGIATTAVISRALGACEHTKATQLGTLVVVVGFLTILTLCLLIWFNQTFILGMLGAAPEILPLIKAYWLPWLISVWLGAMLYFGYSLFRAHGLTKLPGTVMVISSILNMLLDPLFIFTFDMGIAGAAWATICAFLIGCMIIYPGILARRWLCLQFKFNDHLTGLKSLSAVMVPAMASQFIPPISAMAATALIASYGESVVAAWGLGIRIEYFSIIVVLALTMAMPPLVGRFRGSGELNKIQLLVKIAITFIIAWQILIALITIVLSAPISNLLTNDLSVASTLQDYIWRVPMSYGALGTCMIMVSVSNAIGMPMQALLISAFRLLCFYLPCLWIGAQLADINGMFIGATVGNILAGFMSWMIYRRAMQQLKSS